MHSSICTSERNQLLVNHLRNVKAAANRLQVPAALREDLISVGYEALVRAGNRFDPTTKASFTTFSFHAVLGAMYDFLESHWRWNGRHVAIDSDDVAVSEAEPADRRALAAQVLAALETLPALPRNLIRAHFLEEETLSSVAARFGISKTKASTEIQRALQLLRTKLDDSLATWPVHERATKRRFSAKLKDAVLRRASAPGTNIAELAREFDIPPATIHTWRRPLREQAQAALPLAA